MTVPLFFTILMVYSVVPVVAAVGVVLLIDKVWGYEPDAYERAYGVNPSQAPGWVSVPRIGTRVRAQHPQTCLNPEPTFEVVEVQADTTGSGFAVRGENTCWFGVSMILPADESGVDSVDGRKRG
jgi:hypothetical protein